MTQGQHQECLIPAIIAGSTQSTDVDDHSKPSSVADAVAAHQEKVKQILQHHGIIPHYDENQSCFRLHGTVGVDAYKIAMFKVLPCKKQCNHDWTACPYAHPNERARRRSLLICSYYAKVCPDMQNKGECQRGEDCPMTHSMFEFWMHPQRYRSKLCREGVKCSRIYCFFAHTSEELRAPCDGPFTLHPLQPCSSSTAPSAIDTQALASSACTLPAQYGYLMQQPTPIPGVSTMQHQGINSIATAAGPAPNSLSAMGIAHPSLSCDLTLNAGAAASQLINPALQTGLQLAVNSSSMHYTNQGMHLSGTTDSPYAAAGSSSNSTCAHLSLPTSSGTMWVADGMTTLMPKQQQEQQQGQQQFTMSTLHGWQEQAMVPRQLQVPAPLQQQFAFAVADVGLAAQLNQLQLQAQLPRAAAAAPANGLAVLMQNPGTLDSSTGLIAAPVMTMLPTAAAAAALGTLQLQDSSNMLVQGQATYVPAMSHQQLLQQQQQQVPYPMWPLQQ